MRRRTIVGNWRCSIGRYASATLITLGFVFCSMPPAAYAGGVHFGVGFDASPGYVEPPEVVYQPGVVVDRMAPPPPFVVGRTPPPLPPPVVVERAPRPVVVEQRPPVVVYDEPVVVERRSSTYYYYRPSYEYHSYRVETGGGYYRHRSYNSEEDVEY
jgi:hypothetical protein